MRIVRWFIALMAFGLTSVALAETNETPAEAWATVEPGSGKSFKDCPNCPEMVVVPRGSFMMGSPQAEIDELNKAYGVVYKCKPEDGAKCKDELDDWTKKEGPQHPVTIAKPFAVGKFSVTFEEWDACVADGGCGGYSPKDEGWGRGRQPVVNISWNDAKAYVKWLSKKTGKRYRLPTDAEREYVARAGTTTSFWWGAALAAAQANYAGKYMFGGGKTVPVDSFQPNPWGLYQVHGNVSEWVEDCWRDGYKDAPQDGSPAPSDKCAEHVLRGGSWNLTPRYLRSAARYKDFMVSRFYDYGFRVVRTLP